VCVFLEYEGKTINWYYKVFFNKYFPAAHAQSLLARCNTRGTTAVLKYLLALARELEEMITSTSKSCQQSIRMALYQKVLLHKKTHNFLWVRGTNRTKPYDL